MIRFSGAAGGRSGPALNAEASAIQVVVVLVIKDIELDAVGRQFEPCMLVRTRGVTWDAIPNSDSRGIKAAANPRLSI